MAIDQIIKNNVVHEIVPEIAPLFSTSVAYSVGDCVIKDAKLYRFKVDHPAGAWNAYHVDEITVGEELTGLNDLVVIANDEPETEGTKIWIDESGYDDETLVPTWDEFSDRLGEIIETYGTRQSIGAGSLVEHDGNTYMSHVIKASTGSLSFDPNDYDETILSNVITSIVNSFVLSFSTLNTYSKGDFTVRLGTLYECKENNVTGAWDASKWQYTTIIKVINSISLSLMSVIADPLDTITYNEGDYVTYNQKMYRANQSVDCSSYPKPMIIPLYWDEVTVIDALDSMKESFLYFFGPAYNSSNTYEVGDCVCTNGHGYRCTTAITTPEAWNDAHWTTTNVYNEISALIKNIGIGFVTNKQYEVGDYCLYGFPKQSLYRCVTAYAGYWDASKWERTTITDEIKSKQVATVVGTGLIID